MKLLLFFMLLLLCHELLYSEGTGRLWAVVIGNGKYESKRYAELEETTKDAGHVKECLLKDLRVSESCVYPYVENLKYMQLSGSLSWLKKNVESGDRVIYYYSGHGEVVKRKDRDGNVLKDSEEGYILPVDADSENLDLTALKLQDLKNELWNLRAKQVLLVLDSCFAGRAYKKGKVELDHEVESDLSVKHDIPAGRVLMVSCEGREVSCVIPDYKRSAFTYYFVLGLKFGDKNKDGYVDTKEVYDYLYPNVVKKVKDIYNVAQNPKYYAGELEKSFYLRVPVEKMSVNMLILNPRALNKSEHCIVEESPLKLECLIQHGKGVKAI